MAVTEGASRFDLWWVHVSWKGEKVYRVRFLAYGTEGPVPEPIRSYLMGKPIDPTVLSSTATEEDAPFASIYTAVREIPYGETVTYGEIARIVGASPRIVGIAMRRNPTPLVVPCHRVVSSSGIGGFTPDIEIKISLLRMEQGRK